MRLIVIGPRGSGKTTLCKALAKETGLKFMDMSEVLIEKKAEIDFASIDYLVSRIGQGAPARGIGNYIEHIHNFKDQFRGGLIALGNILCDADPAYVWRECIKRGAKIMGGVRRKVEMDTIWRYSQPDDLIIKIAGSCTDGDNYELEHWAPEDPSKMLVVDQHPDTESLLVWIGHEIHREEEFRAYTHHHLPER